MKLGIGIDTGGTYTDAVVYDFESREILCSAKSLTTKDDLSIGIISVLDKLEYRYLHEAGVVSLSTTLATNACVEGRGGRSKLLFIGVDNATVQKVGTEYGLLNSDIYYCISGHGSFDGKIPAGFDEESLIRDTTQWLSDAEGLAITEIYAMRNSAVCEKRAKELISETYDFPVILASDLFSGLDSIQRGAGTLLNARLVPIIREFLTAIKKALKQRDIKAPVVIVRSDGSLMSEEFSKLRPVETILCGPASSVLGGMKLTGCNDCVIVDIGGTTTDISLVKNSMPVKARDGVSIGGWKTFVRGVYIDTFGLGGDSAVRAKGQSLVLDSKRVMPISLLTQTYPQTLDDLRSLLKRCAEHTKPLHEFICLLKDISEKAGYTDNEKAFCEALRNGPLIISEAAARTGTDIYRFDFKRLEDEGVIIKAGLTPTDIMHLKGDFDAYDTEGAVLAARFVMRCMGLDDTKPEELDRFCDMVYDKVKKTLYCGIVRVLLLDKYPRMFKNGLDPQTSELIANSWDEAENKSFFNVLFQTTASIVGIGAPAHIFLPDVAAALGTDCKIPKFAHVANAAGAVADSISVTAEVEVRPNYVPGGITGYTVFLPDGNIITKKRQDAVDCALSEAKRLAAEEARKRGVSGDIKIETEITTHSGAAARDTIIDMGSSITATAIGGALL